MTLDQIAYVTVLLVIVVQSHLAGYSYSLAKNSKRMFNRALISSVFSAFLAVILLYWIW